MITPSFSLTATERVLPKLALDFTTASLDSRITFTRALNTATRINASGSVEVVNADVARFDYDPTTLACRGLLIEESRINSIRNNTMVGAVISPFTPPTNWAITAVSGLTASIIELGTDSGIDYIDIRFVGTGTGAQAIAFETTTGITALTGEAWSTNFYCKLIGGSLTNVVSLKPSMIERTAIGGAVLTNDGSAFTPTSASLISQRQTYSATLSGGATVGKVQPRILYQVAGAVDFTIRIGLPQCEKGAFTTSVIKTSTVAVTRNADVAVMTSTNFSSWYTATTGSAAVWAIPQTATGTKPLIQFDDTTALEIITLRGNVANPELYIVDGGVSQAQIDAGTIVANTAYKLSGAWNTNSCAAAQNGAAAVTDNTATIPTPTQLRIGSDGTNYASAWVQKILYWPQRIIDAEVQAFSKL